MQPLSLDDLFQFRIVGQLDLSPDGATVAFIEAAFDLDADDTKWNIWVLPTDGSAPPRQLTSGAARDSVPRWSPDGVSVAFLSARAEPWRQDLHLVDVASGDVTTIATLPRGIIDYRWSPTGDGVALIGGPDYPDDPARPAASAAERRARYLQRVIHVEKLGYRGPSEFHDDEPPQLWWAPLGGDPVQLTDDPRPIAVPDFLPDGRISYVTNLGGDYDSEPTSHVWAIARDGGASEPISDPVNQLRAYSIGPDGSIAWVGLPVSHYSFGSHDPRLFVDGKDVTEALDRPASRASEVQSLTLDYLTATPGPIRASDGTLYVHVVDAGCGHVYRYLDGELAPVLTGRQVVGDYRVRGDVLAYTSTSPDLPVGIFVAAADGSDARLIYDPNPWVAKRALGEVRNFTVAHSDGTMMDAWAVLPAGYDGGRLPAILDIHPGPHSSFPWDFRLDHRLLAEAGFAVLSVNQPGSQGYGEKFAAELDGRWGEADLPAYEATVDESVRLGLVDADRVGVTGATYGGHAALWCLAHSTKFKAAVTNRAITDLDQMYGDGDIGDTFLPASLGAEPWEDPELYRRLSPVTHVTSITAPVRLLAFSGNNRITVAASEQIFRRLRKLGVPTDLLVFPPGSATVLMPNRPWSKRRLVEATAEWFQQHLR